jgi:hypothetical protein
VPDLGAVAGPELHLPAMATPGDRRSSIAAAPPPMRMEAFDAGDADPSSTRAPGPPSWTAADACLPAAPESRAPASRGGRCGRLAAPAAGLSPTPDRCRGRTATAVSVRRRRSNRRDRASEPPPPSPARATSAAGPSIRGRRDWERGRRGRVGGALGPRRRWEAPAGRAGGGRPWIRPAAEETRPGEKKNGPRGDGWVGVF